MAIILSGSGIDMGGNPVSNASQVDGVVMNENGAGVATENQVGTANSVLVKTALNASGNAPIYACRAWVNFNGTGTVAIRASGNVSSITDNGVGNYTINFTTAMPDANYCMSSATTAVAAYPNSTNTANKYYNGIYTTSSIQIAAISNQAGSAYYDTDFISLSFFR